MPLEIETLTVGPLEVNCYLAGCDEHRVCAVIDPGDSPARILSAAAARGWEIKLIVNTHGHADHAGANGKLKSATGAPILIHRDDAPVLTHPVTLDLAAYIGVGVSPPPDRLLADGEVIEMCPCVSFEVIHTPGHSPGGICLRSGDVLFTGDTLFHMSIGRSDLPGGNAAVLFESIRTRIFTIPDGVGVLPGHGDGSTIGFEKKNNPFLSGAIA